MDPGGSDPHRRNLMMISIAFLIFFLGDGELSEEGLRLGMVGVDINSPWVVGLSAWLMLFWFAWQYWLHHPNCLDRFRESSIANNAQRCRKLVNREFAGVLQKVDLLVTPTMTQPAAAFEGYDASGTARGPSFTAP